MLNIKATTEEGLGLQVKKKESPLMLFVFWIKTINLKMFNLPKYKSSP